MNKMSKKQLAKPFLKFTILIIVLLFMSAIIYWYLAVYRLGQEEVTRWSDIESATFTNGNFSYSIEYPKSWGDFQDITNGEMTEPVGLHGSRLTGFSVLLFDQVTFGKNKNWRPLPNIQIEIARYETDEEYMDAVSSRKLMKERFPDWNINDSLDVHPIVTRNNTLYFFRDDKKFIYEISCIEALANAGFCDKYIESFRFIDDKTNNPYYPSGN